MLDRARARFQALSAEAAEQLRHRPSVNLVRQSAKEFMSIDAMLGDRVKGGFLAGWARQVPGVGYAGGYAFELRALRRTAN
jgi:hypothetical protein